MAQAQSYLLSFVSAIFKSDPLTTFEHFSYKLTDMLGPHSRNLFRNRTWSRFAFNRHVSELVTQHQQILKIEDYHYLLQRKDTEESLLKPRLSHAYLPSFLLACNDLAES